MTICHALLYSTVKAKITHCIVIPGFRNLELAIEQTAVVFPLYICKPDLNMSFFNQHSLE